MSINQRIASSFNSSLSGVAPILCKEYTSPSTVQSGGLMTLWGRSLGGLRYRKSDFCRRPGRELLRRRKVSPASESCAYFCEELERYTDFYACTASQFQAEGKNVGARAKPHRGEVEPFHTLLRGRGSPMYGFRKRREGGERVTPSACRKKLRDWGNR